MLTFRKSSQQWWSSGTQSRFTSEFQFLLLQCLQLVGLSTEAEGGGGGEAWINIHIISYLSLYTYLYLHSIPFKYLFIAGILRQILDNLKRSWSIFPAPNTLVVLRSLWVSPGHQSQWWRGECWDYSPRDPLCSRGAKWDSWRLIEPQS